MIRFIVGVPGSGKTYYAVNQIFDVFSNEKSSHFKENGRFYTNINQFNFSSFDGIGFSYNHDDIYPRLQTLHLAATVQKYDDSQLKELAKELSLYDSLFVIDEAQNIFDVDDKVLIWWLSYHRHLNQNIILITQNLSLISSKYKAFSEFFYRAMPSSLRIFGSVFRYKVYVGSRMSKAEQSETLKLKFNPAVYSLYHSGANTQGKKVIYKFVFVAIFAFFAFAFGIYAIKQKMSPSVESNTSTDTSKQHVSGSALTKNQQPLQSPLSSSKLKVICSSTDCFVNNKVVNINAWQKTVKQQGLKQTGSALISGFIIFYYELPKGVNINEDSF